MSNNKPPPVCFSCGKDLEGYYDIYHERSKTEPHHRLLDEMGFARGCCRRMFLGDNVELRQIRALYDTATINDSPHL